MSENEPINKYLRVLKALNDYAVEYILIGGLAVILHGMPRFTIDIDLFLKGTKENIEHLKKALKSIFKEDRSINELTYDEFKQYSVIRYGPPEGDFYIDLLTRVGEAFGYDDLEYEIIEIDKVKIRTATVKTLIKMKKNTIREKDKADVLFLEELVRKNRLKQ